MNKEHLVKSDSVTFAIFFYLKWRIKKYKENS